MRYAGYKAMQLVKDGIIRLAFCWTDVRRDFVNVGKRWPQLIPWALEWLLKIRELYHLQRQRLLCRHDPAAFVVHDRKLRDAVDTMSTRRDEQRRRKGLHSACRKTVESLSEH
jgi:hypothetical protein